MAAKQILIVDDTREISRLLEAALHVLDEKLQIRVVPSAEEASLEVSRRLYDLLIVDVRLPGISGLEFTQKVRSVRKNIRIIQISGLNDPSLKDSAISMGADVFLPKPLAIGEFLSTVEGLLDVEPFIPPQPTPPVPASVNPTPEPLPVEPLPVTPEPARPVWNVAPVAEPPAPPPTPPVTPPPAAPQPVAPPVEARPAKARAEARPEKRPESRPEPRPAARPPSPTDLLTKLRQNLDAKVVALADERGRMVVRAGDLPDQALETSVVPALLASINASGAAGRLVNPESPESAILVRGPVFDYLATPLGFQYMLLVVIERTSNSLYLAQAMEDLFSTHEKLLNSLSQLSPTVVPAAVAPEPAAEDFLEALAAAEKAPAQPPVFPSSQRPAVPAQPVEAGDELDALLNQANPGALKADELDAFWEQLASGKSPDSGTNPGTLSYDQASRLGLTPPDEGDH